MFWYEWYNQFYKFQFVGLLRYSPREFSPFFLLFSRFLNKCENKLIKISKDSTSNKNRRYLPYRA